MTSQLQRLVKPFPRSMIQTKPGKFQAEYVSHSEVVQKLLAVVGPYSFEVTETFRNKDGQIDAVIARLALTVDGERISISEVGECEQPGNWNTDGARLKDAASDAFKRCAMRVGVGLHLWAQDRFVLDTMLATAEGDNSEQ